MILCLQDVIIHVLKGRKKEASKVKQTNKAKQHSTPIYTCTCTCTCRLMFRRIKVADLRIFIYAKKWLMNIKHYRLALMRDEKEERKKQARLNVHVHVQYM